jgi:hypothetical protein
LGKASFRLGAEGFKAWRVLGKKVERREKKKAGK